MIPIKKYIYKNSILLRHDNITSKYFYSNNNKRKYLFLLKKRGITHNLDELNEIDKIKFHFNDLILTKENIFESFDKLLKLWKNHNNIMHPYLFYFYKDLLFYSF